jgi:hypothetical protein
MTRAQQANPTCATCIYHGVGEDEWFECRRHPPRAPADKPREIGSFPICAKNNWCGEYSPRKERRV